MLLLRVLRLDEEIDGPQSLGLSFAMGFGLIGWLVFPMGFTGLFQAAAFLVLLLIGFAGLPYLARRPWPTIEPLDVMGWGLVLMLGLVMGLDVIESLTPPADADSLAYHFNLPKQFLEAGEIFFVKRAFDGAVPLLVQMAFVPALAIGGEQALLYWSMVSGWAPAFLLYVLCRFYMSRNWSIAVALIYLTIPAVVFAGGTGHVEGRLGLFVLVTAWAISGSLRTNKLGFALLAGVAVGFYAGAKYLGLFFTLAGGLTILAGRGWFVRGVLFSATAVAIGLQWYLWNAINTGDPFFPVFYQQLGMEDLGWWSKPHDQIFKARYFGVETVVPQNILWMIAYPFKATFDSIPIFESRRTGFGPFLFVILPFVCLGICRFRQRLLSHPLMPFATVAVLYYALWFLWGPSQRIRHLLPILPLVLLCATYAAVKYADRGYIKLPLASAVAATLILQLAGQAFFDIKFFRYLTSQETRESYLTRSVVNFAPIPWINDNLTKENKLLLHERQVFYYLEIPFEFASNVAQGGIDLDPKQSNPRRLYSQLKAQGITHLLIERLSKTPGAPYRPPHQLLARAGCFTVLQSFNSKRFASRTLPTKSFSSLSIYDVVRLKEPSCLDAN